LAITVLEKIFDSIPGRIKNLITDGRRISQIPGNKDFIIPCGIYQWSESGRITGR
jgi:hypothetical protein